MTAHRDKYTSFLKQSRKQRIQKANKPVNPAEDSVNLGLDTHKGMGIGDPNFKPKPDPLWLADHAEAGKCQVLKSFAPEVIATMTPHKVSISGCPVWLCSFV